MILNYKLFTESKLNPFSLEKLFELPNIDDRITYCEQHLKLLGAGSSRKVYRYDNFAIKVAKNEKGVIQNQNEINLYDEKYSDILAKIYPESTKEIVLMEMCKPAKDVDFYNLLSVNVYSLGIFLRNYYNSIHGKSTIKLNASEEKLSNDKTVNELCRFISDTGVAPNDFTKKNTYGVNRGKLLIIDYGLHENNIKQLL